MVRADDEEIDSALEEPVATISPRQSLVFYDGVVVVGGGVIERGIRARSVRSLPVFAAVRSARFTHWRGEIMPRLQWVLGAAVLMAVSACIPLGRRHMLASYVVTGKTGEDMLIGDDGATCRVSAEVFERIQIGESHRCVWAYPDAGREGSAVLDTKRGVTNPTATRPKVPPGASPQE